MTRGSRLERVVVRPGENRRLARPALPVPHVTNASLAAVASVALVSACSSALRQAPAALPDRPPPLLTALGRPGTAYLPFPPESPCVAWSLTPLSSATSGGALVYQRSPGQAKVSVDFGLDGDVLVLVARPGPDQGGCRSGAARYRVPVAPALLLSAEGCRRAEAAFREPAALAFWKAVNETPEERAQRRRQATERVKELVTRGAPVWWLEGRKGRSPRCEEARLLGPGELLKIEREGPENYTEVRFTVAFREEELALFGPYVKRFENGRVTESAAPCFERLALCVVDGDVVRFGKPDGRPLAWFLSREACEAEQSALAGQIELARRLSTPDCYFAASQGSSPLLSDRTDKWPPLRSRVPVAPPQ